MLNETVNILHTELVKRGQFAAADYAIFIFLIIASILIGVYFGVKEWSTATTKDYLIGGRDMHPVPVFLSLMGGFISALSVLGK